MNRPQTQEYPPSFSSYMLAVEGNVLDVLKEQYVAVPHFFGQLANKAQYAYAPGKWTIAELLLHLVDTERVMSYRLMCIARGEQMDLPGFDENAYATQARKGKQDYQRLCEQFAALRKSNILLIEDLSTSELDTCGTANANRISVRALVFMLAGHVAHHIAVVKERYL